MPRTQPVRPGGRPAPDRRPAAVAPARACAYAVLRRVFEDAAWADRALRAEIDRHRLDARDRALATRLAYGAVQRRLTVDWLIERLAERPVERLDAPVVAALRLGLFQIGWLERVPHHAAVDESVELAKRHARRGSGLVNAVLRRATNEAGALLAALRDATPEQAALAHSHPAWIVSLWWEAYGPDAARALLRANNQPAEAVVRVNTLRARPAAVDLGVPVRPASAPVLPEALVLDAPFDVHGSTAWAEGLVMPQSRAAMAVSRLLDPQPGQRVLDLCAAPGGKTTHIAALMEDRGQVVAVERHPGRADALRRTAARMGATCVEVVTGDAAEPPAGEFDRVLVDPPCTDLGTLASRPDARWRKDAGDPARLAALQRRMLDAAVARLRPGGVLVYSTCTLSPEENERQAERLLAARDDLAPGPAPGSDLAVWEHPDLPFALRTLPGRDGTEGFFMARFVKR